MVDGEVVEVIEGVLGEADEVLGLLVGQGGGVDGYLEGEDGAAGLRRGWKSATVQPPESRARGHTLPSAHCSMRSRGRLAR